MNAEHDSPRGIARLHLLMPPMGGLGVFSALIMPVSIFLTLRKDRGPVGKFITAGAVGPERARRPSSLQITAKYMIEGPVRRGVLVSTNDGRYYVDLARYRTWRRRMIIMAAAIPTAALAVGFGAAWWIIRSQ